ncbi:hypothetical protein BC936DRAFT_144941 [Jimgerdemannia flammicorona]|uniref:Pyridoxal phosphate-dependent transferase n=1 Tax=Jimgerdemannia flammicorona TaxID=994334 RepID=A0A433DB99_9FUNG|nr:hypothetical protein BC936DRAFT_144941 [Jimgerdemannia flammicorona]
MVTPLLSELASFDKSFSTLSLHADAHLADSSDIAPAIGVSTTFRFPDPDVTHRHGEGLNGEKHHIYSRESTNNRDRLEIVLGTLNEGHSVTYASGLAAGFAAVIHLRPNRVAIRGGYHGTHGFLKVYRKLRDIVRSHRINGISLWPWIWFVEPDLLCPINDAIFSHIRSSRKEIIDIDSPLLPGDLVWLESPHNPDGLIFGKRLMSRSWVPRAYLCLTPPTFANRDPHPDIAHYVERSHAVGAKVLVDATFAPPPLQYPFRLGMRFSSSCNMCLDLLPLISLELDLVFLLVGCDANDRRRRHHALDHKVLLRSLRWSGRVVGRAGIDAWARLSVMAVYSFLLHYRESYGNRSVHVHWRHRIFSHDEPQLRLDRTYTGSVLGSLETWLLLRSVRTLKLRVNQQSQTATALAAWLAKASDHKEHDGIPAHSIHSVLHSSLQHYPQGWDVEKQHPGGHGATFSVLVSADLTNREHHRWEDPGSGFRYFMESLKGRQASQSHRQGLTRSSTISLPIARQPRSSAPPPDVVLPNAARDLSGRHRVADRVAVPRRPDHRPALGACQRRPRGSRGSQGGLAEGPEEGHSGGRYRDGRVFLGEGGDRWRGGIFASALRADMGELKWIVNVK